MTNSIDFEALRARRAEGILYGFDAPDEADWLDEWGGTYTLDDGHPGSYDHEAVATTDSDTATLTCQCGAWSGSAPATTDEAPEYLFEQWRSHVYKTTGRWKDTPELGRSAISGHFPDDGAEAEDLRAENARLRETLAAERLQGARAARDGLAAFRSLKAERDRLAAEAALLRSWLDKFTDMVLDDFDAEGGAA